ncbi:hypothetical protein ACHQM5_024799 [Ranunculus cassubicifolius]
MDSDQGKLFVGGISFETTEESLKDHFSKYGQVEEALIVKDKLSGNARGFGFVLFSDPSVVDQALKDQHVILSRTVEVKRAIPRGGRHYRYQSSRGFGKNYSNDAEISQFSTKKIFVGGLPASVNEEEFKAYFEKFGRITDVVVMYDNITHRPRGFGFITFDSESSVEYVMQQPFHMLNNKSVEVKRAVPKDGSGLPYNGNGYTNNTGMGAGDGSIFGRYQGGFIPNFGPRFNVFTGYAPPPIPGYPYVGYPIGGYGGIGFGPASMAPPPRGPWNSVGMVGVRRSPVPFGSPLMYPGYMNGGFVGLPNGDYQGIMTPAADGKGDLGDSCDAQLAEDVSALRLDDGKSDDDSSLIMGSSGAEVSEEIQTQKGADEQSKPNTVGNSS